MLRVPVGRCASLGLRARRHPTPVTSVFGGHTAELDWGTVRLLQHRVPEFVIMRLCIGNSTARPGLLALLALTTCIVRRLDIRVGW